MTDDKTTKPREIFVDLIEDDFFIDNPNGKDIRDELNAFLSAYDALKAQAEKLAEALEVAIKEMAFCDSMDDNKTNSPALEIFCKPALAEFEKFKKEKK